MHYRRLASLILGAWLGGSLFLMAVATRNFRVVDEIVSAPDPEASQYIQKIGRGEARILLRHQASLQNLGLFENWELVQLGLGLLVLLALFFGVESRPSAMVLTLIMIAGVAFQHWLLTPKIVTLGHVIDLIPSKIVSEQHTHFWNYQTAYRITELAKMSLGVLLALTLLRRRRRSLRRVDSEVDTVNHSDHSHVDR